MKAKIVSRLPQIKFIQLLWRSEHPGHHVQNKTRIDNCFCLAYRFIIIYTYRVDIYIYVYMLWNYIYIFNVIVKEVTYEKQHNLGKNLMVHCSFRGP